MNISFLKTILNRGAKFFGLHPDVGNLLSGSFRLTNPASAAFPTENLPLASRVIASGMWNYCFFQFYRHFAGPYWVEKQYNPEDPSFIPRAGSMLSVNLTNRDWMGFRSPAGKHHAMVDPSGALSPVIGYYSIETALKENGMLRLASKGELEIRQSLLGDLPIPVTEYRSKSATLKWTAAGSLKNDYIINQIEYESFDQEQEIIISIRPFNPEGAAFIHTIRKDLNNIVHINDMPEMILFSAPDKTVLSNLISGDAYFSESNSENIFCPDGIATAAFSYKINGKGKISFAARTYEQKFNIPSNGGILKSLFSYPKKISNRNIYKRMDLFLTEGRSLKNLRKKRKKFPRFFQTQKLKTNPAPEKNENLSNYNEAIDENENHITDEIFRAKKSWEKIIEKASVFRCGREEWNRAAKIFTGHMMTLYADENITPGVFTYRQFWFRDAAYMLSALFRWNLTEEARNVLWKYPSLQSNDGFFKSHEGEWDSNGQALWTLSSYIKHTGDTKLLKHAYPSMKKGAEWIIQKRKAGLEKKLMPAGFSAEHLGPGDHYYWDNFWSIAGLFETSSAAGQMGMINDEAYFLDQAEKYVQDIIAVSEEGRKQYDMITSGPERPADAGMIGSLSLLYPLNLSNIFPETQILNTVKAIYQNYFSRGLFFHPIIHSGYNIYLSLHAAQAFIQMDDIYTARKILKSVLAHKKELWTYPEALHPRTGGGVMGDGFHGWAFAEILQVLREFVIHEREDTIYLFKGLRKKELFCENLEFGPFPVSGGSLKIRGSMNSERMHLTISFNRREPCPYKKIAIRLPFHYDPELLPEAWSSEGVALENGRWLICRELKTEIEIRLQFTKQTKHVDR
ncbi:MAG: hypothetical protein OEZ34_03525 [Spirochaetia bacterium]|nr:hypothetical protein [Spirochaetia bacterium]